MLEGENLTARTETGGSLLIAFQLLRQHDVVCTVDLQGNDTRCKCCLRIPSHQLGIVIGCTTLIILLRSESDDSRAGRIPGIGGKRRGQSRRKRRISRIRTARLLIEPRERDLQGSMFLIDDGTRRRRQRCRMSIGNPCRGDDTAIEQYLDEIRRSGLRLDGGLLIARASGNQH